MNVVFDALGTLFDLAPLRERLGAEATEAWFERILHSAVTLTMLGDFVPFDELARTTLATACAKLDIDVDQEDVLQQLRRLPAADGAREALESCDRAFVLTNGGRAGGEALLANAGLDGLVERVFGVDEVRAYKPDSRPYRLVVDAIGDTTLVAAHAWDIVGGVRAGMQGIWVSAGERVWPFPEQIAPHATVPSLAQLAQSLLSDDDLVSAETGGLHAG